MTQVQVGDKVRVTLEGEVTSSGPARFCVNRSSDIRVPHSPGVTVEVLARALKVGDMIEGRKAYDALPLGAVLDGYYLTRQAIMRTVDGFALSAGGTLPHGHLHTPRRLAFLPE